MPLQHVNTFASRGLAVLGAATLVASAVVAGSSPVTAQEDEGRSVVVTTEVLGSVVSQLVGDAGEITVIMPSGANPHSYDPSARDAERILNADVLVSNGLDLEEALLSILEAAVGEGVNWFEAADHVAARALDDDDHDEADEHDHGLDDPHIWTDPLAMRDVVRALAPVLDEAGIDVGARAESLVAELESLDTEITEILSVVPPEARALVTGHRSLGYFADRYEFDLIGTVIPSLSTSGQPTARELSQLIADVKANNVPAVFTEVGTPGSVAQAVAGDSGAELVELTTSQLPDGGTYQDLIRDIATTVAVALTP
jgi:zinc/manganese transport system substrate-binding protein